MLQELTEEWEQCDRKLRETKDWTDKSRQSLDSVANKRRPIREQLGLRDRIAAEVTTQKTKATMAMEKLQVEKWCLCGCLVEVWFIVLLGQYFVLECWDGQTAQSTYVTCAYFCNLHRYTVYVEHSFIFSPYSGPLPRRLSPRPGRGSPEQGDPHWPGQTTGRHHGADSDAGQVSGAAGQIPAGQFFLQCYFSILKCVKWHILVTYHTKNIPFKN